MSKEIKQEEIYRVGDKVFDIRYGWGVIKQIDEGFPYPILVIYSEDIGNSYSLNGRNVDNDKVPTLSFTEYTLNNFSQERLPFDLPDVGEEIMCSDNDVWRLCKFEGYDMKEKYPVITNKGLFKHFKRIRQ